MEGPRRRGRPLPRRVGAAAKVAKAGVKPGAPVNTRCQGEGRASANAFVLERLGFEASNSYLGRSDWGNASDTPVEVEEGARSNDRRPRHPGVKPPGEGTSCALMVGLDIQVKANCTTP